VEVVAGFWDEAVKVAQNREYVTYTGSYKGAPISCTSTGIGCPSTAIALEELARTGANTFIRIGTCGAFQDDTAVGDIVIFDSAMRLDGTSQEYAPVEYPAVAHHEVVQASIEAGELLDYRTHVGTTRSSDGFYSGHSKTGSSFNDYWHSGWSERMMDLKRMNILAAEMEASIIFVLARLWGLRAGGISVVVDNVFHVADEHGHFNPETVFEAGAENINKLGKMGSEIVRLLHARDTA
jgi:uridine phosphorylase